MTKYVVASVLAILGSACGAEDAVSDDSGGGKADNGASCPAGPSGWRAMASYVPPSGTNPTFAPYTAKPVWSGSEAFFLGTVFEASDFHNVAAAYDPSTDTWRTLTSPFSGAERYDLFSRWTGATWIVFGGFYNQATKKFGMNGRRYNPATDTWTDVPAVPVPDLRAAAVEWSPATNELIVFGGVRLKAGATTTNSDSYEATNETWVWSLDTNTWRSVAKSPLSPRRESHAAWDGHRIVFAWGRPYEPFSEEDRSIPGTATYDPVTEAWTMLPEPAVQDRMAFAADTLGSHVTAFWGGQPANGDGDFWLTLHDGAAYNGVTGQWQTISDPGLPGTYRMGFATWSANERLYVVGGDSLEDNGDFNHYVDGAAWNAATATWEQLPPAPQSRSFPASVWTGCDAIVYGGHTLTPVDQTGMMFRP